MPCAPNALPKEVYSDPEVLEKARAMIRCGHLDSFVSDYLGMKLSQVEALRRGVELSRSGRESIAVSGPAIDDREERAHRQSSEFGSEALLARIQRLTRRSGVQVRRAC